MPDYPQEGDLPVRSGELGVRGADSLVRALGSGRKNYAVRVMPKLCDPPYPRSCELATPHDCLCRLGLCLGDRLGRRPGPEQRPGLGGHTPEKARPRPEEKTMIEVESRGDSAVVLRPVGDLDIGSSFHYRHVVDDLLSPSLDVTIDLVQVGSVDSCRLGSCEEPDPKPAA